MMMKGFLNSVKNKASATLARAINVAQIDDDDDDDGDFFAGVDNMTMKTDGDLVIELRVRFIHSQTTFVSLPSKYTEILLERAPKFPLPMKVKVIERSYSYSSSYYEKRKKKEGGT